MEASELQKGDNVRITTGTFSGLVGVVDKLYPEALVVMVPIEGGCPAPVELSYDKVERVASEK